MLLRNEESGGKGFMDGLALDIGKSRGCCSPLLHIKMTADILCK